MTLLGLFLYILWLLMVFQKYWFAKERNKGQYINQLRSRDGLGGAGRREINILMKIMMKIMRRVMIKEIL